MASPAMDGFHSVVSYSWKYNGYECKGEDTPIFYAAREGLYTCCVHSASPIIEMKSSFSVISKCMIMSIITSHMSSKNIP